MKFKENAKFDPVFFLGPCGYALSVVDGIASHQYGYEITITSGCEFVEKRREGSDHYIHRAFDIRRKDFPKEFDVEVFAGRCRNALGSAWVVIVKRDHIHFGFKG
tara:strand:- start:259 stop:573 length:315 start_codon:yes stop_codon:yes gene_type:complete